MPPNGVCNLGSVDVSKFITYSPTDVKFDWDKYKAVCATATRALNNIVDVGSWPTEEIAAWVEDNKPIGLGIMGFADACFALNMRYGSPSSEQFAKMLNSVMYEEAERVSIQLGKERGIPAACASLPTPRRNVTLLSIAPTGTISLIAGCSSGCEPVFEYVQIRQDNTGSYIMVNAAIKALLGIDDKVYPKGYDYAALKNEAAEIAKKAKSAYSNVMVSANDVTVEEHIRIQAAFQNAFGDGKAVDSGVSKTINMPNSATVDDVKAAYQLAYDLKCKGITIYRDGSKFFQILSSAKPVESTKSENPDYTIVPAKRFKMTHNGERWYVIVGENERGEAKEVFTVTQNTDDTLATTDAVARMISLALRYNAPVEKVVSQLRKVRQYSIGSFPAMIARVLSNYIPANEDSTQDLICTECKSTNVELVGGCPTCKDCGYSKCG